jgi:hypothetical protein
VTARAWWASALAGVGGVLGAVVGALLLRSAAPDEGLGELAGMVAGIMLGAPAGSFIGYLIGLFALLAAEVPRRWRAAGTMLAVAFLGGVLVLIVLGIAGRAGSTPVALGLLVLLPTAWFVGGAAFATYVGHAPRGDANPADVNPPD